MNAYEFISVDYEVQQNSVIAKFKGPDKHVVIYRKKISMGI
jgi:hypothetical protein